MRVLSDVPAQFANSGWLNGRAHAEAPRSFPLQLGPNVPTRSELQKIKMVNGTVALHSAELVV